MKKVTLLAGSLYILITLGCVSTPTERAPLPGEFRYQAAAQEELPSPDSFTINTGEMLENLISQGEQRYISEIDKGIQSFTCRVSRQAQGFRLDLFGQGIIDATYNSEQRRTAAGDSLFAWSGLAINMLSRIFATVTFPEDLSIGQEWSLSDTSLGRNVRFTVADSALYRWKDGELYPAMVIEVRIPAVANTYQLVEFHYYVSQQHGIIYANDWEQQIGKEALRVSLRSFLLEGVSQLQRSSAAPPEFPVAIPGNRESIFMNMRIEDEDLVVLFRSKSPLMGDFASPYLDVISGGTALQVPDDGEPRYLFRVFGNKSVPALIPDDKSESWMPNRALQTGDGKYLFWNLDYRNTDAQLGLYSTEEGSRELYHFDGLGTDSLSTGIRTRNGEYLLFGTSGGTFSDQFPGVSVINESRGPVSFWFTRLAENYEIKKIAFYGSNWWDTSGSGPNLYEDAQSNIYFMGHTGPSAGNTTPNTFPGSDNVTKGERTIGKLSPDLELQWIQRIGDSRLAYVFPEGNLLLKEVAADGRETLQLYSSEGERLNREFYSFNRAAHSIRVTPDDTGALFLISAIVDDVDGERNVLVIADTDGNSLWENREITVADGIIQRSALTAGGSRVYILVQSRSNKVQWQPGPGYREYFIYSFPGIRD